MSEDAEPGNMVLMEAQSQRSEPGGKVRLDLRVPPMPSMVSEVRRAFGQLPLPTPLLDDARLLVTELVTNCIRHAGLHRDDRIRVRAELLGTKLRVDVFDRADAGRLGPVAGAIHPAPGAQSGWGLYLVESVATRWGRGRGRYWFELEVGRRTASRGA